MLRDVWRRATCCAALCGCTCLLLSCGSALAAPTWLPSTTLSAAGQNTEEPQVAVDGQGDALAVWEGFNSLSDFFVQAALRPAAGTWEAPLTISADSRSGTEPQIAFDAQGDATAAWSVSTSPGEATVQVATRPLGGSWQTPLDLSVAGEEASVSGLALSGRGNAVVIWQDYESGKRLVKTRVRTSGGTWQAPETLAPCGEQTYVSQVALDEQGNAIALLDCLEGGHFVAEVARRPQGATWQTPHPLSTASAETQPSQVVLDAQGTATVLWYSVEGVNTAVWSTVLPAASETWEAPVDVSGVGNKARDLHLAADSLGDATATWEEEVSGKFVVRAASRPAGGSWQTPLTASGSGFSVEDSQLTVSPLGDATVLYRQFSETHYVLWASTQAPGGSWATPIAISAPASEGSDPQVASDGQGDATAVWTASEGSKGIVQAAGYDAAGPQLGSPSIPATGTVGSPVRFSASPLDVWSALAATNWSFGDGTSSTGMTVTHTYTAAGTYTVELSSTDALGNATSRKAQITIAAPSLLLKSGPALGSLPLQLTALSQTHRRWREGSKQARLARKSKAHGAPLGTTFSFSLNEAARVSFTFTQTVAGRRVAGKCRPQGKHNRGHARCRATLTRATLVYDVSAGRHELVFQGRVGAKRRLPLGTYAVRVVASNVTAGKRSAAQTLRFTIAG